MPGGANRSLDSCPSLQGHPMALVPELEAFLELVELGRLTGKSRAMHQQTPEQARADFELASLALDQPLDAIQCQALGITARDGWTLSARLYRAPQLGAGPQPT